MSNSPLISVVMPAYDAELYISESIDSVIRQSYRNWELLVVDDGSLDRTKEIVEEYVKKDSRIKYLYQTNGKQGRARNKAIKQSKGEYIAFLDSDDLWVEDKLLKQVYCLLKFNEIDLIFSQGFTLTDDEIIMDYNVKIQRWTWVKNGNELLECNQIPILSVIVKKKSLIEVGGFTELESVQNSEDYHLWLTLLSGGYTFESISDRLFYYRIHPSQQTYGNPFQRQAVIYVYADLCLRKVVDYKCSVLRNRVKWFMFDNLDLKKSYLAIICIFPNKKLLIRLIILLVNKFKQIELAKKIAYKFL